MTLYAELFNATGKALVIENCHQGQNFTDGGDPGQMGVNWCPYNLFRTSGDIINVWDRVIENLLSVVMFLSPAPAPGTGAPPVGRALEPPIFFPPAGPPHGTQGLPLSRPGCWACALHAPHAPYSCALCRPGSELRLSFLPPFSQIPTCSR
jgi:hypothetical protein